MVSHKRPHLPLHNQGPLLPERRTFVKQAAALLGLGLLGPSCAISLARFDPKQTVICAPPQQRSVNEIKPGLRSWPNVLVFDYNGNAVNYDEGSKPGPLVSSISSASSGIVNFLTRYAQEKAVVLAFGDSPLAERRYLNFLQIKFKDVLLVVSLSILPKQVTVDQIKSATKDEFERNLYQKLIIPQASLDRIIQMLDEKLVPDSSQFPYYVLLDHNGMITSVSFGEIDGIVCSTWSALLQSGEI